MILWSHLFRALVVGISEGTDCLCGFDYERKLAAGGEQIDLGDLDLGLEQLCKDVEELPADLCTLPCCPETTGVCRSLF